MEAISEDKPREIEIKHEVQDPFEFVKVESADYEENVNGNLACLVSFHNTEDESDNKKSRGEELSFVTVKEEAVHIKSEQNWEVFDEDLQHNVPNQEQIKSAKHKKSKQPEPSKTSVYQCSHCPYASGLKDPYLRHLKRHQNLDKPELMYCYECPFSSIFKASLKRHVQKHRTRTQTYKGSQCRYCSYNSTRVSTVTIHEKLHCKIDIKAVKSSEKCGAKQEPDSGVEIKTEKLHRCQQCPYSCLTERSIRSHQACHDSETGIKCQYCSFRTENAILFGIHRKLHTLEPFKCSECSYETWRPIYFKNHCLSHGPKHLRDKFKCSKCLFTAPRRPIMQNHFKNQHSDLEEDLVYCFECPFSSRCQTSLLQHIECHRTKTNFRCKYCSYCATRATNLKSHEELHDTNLCLSL